MKPLVYDKRGKVPNFVFNSKELWYQPTGTSVRLKRGSGHVALRSAMYDLITTIQKQERPTK
jgi:hypothetical protein